MASLEEKIGQLNPETLKELGDFVDFLLARQIQESFELTEKDFSDYLANLEDYEDKLARGEIQW